MLNQSGSFFNTKLVPNMPSPTSAFENSYFPEPRARQIHISDQQPSDTGVHPVPAVGGSTRRRCHPRGRRAWILVSPHVFRRVSLNTAYAIRFRIVRTISLNPSVPSRSRETLSACGAGFSCVAAVQLIEFRAAAGAYMRVCGLRV